jgi:hypothetical protein
MTMTLPPMRGAVWAGPVLVALGLAGILALSFQSPDDRSMLGWWMLSNARAYERVLPLVGLGTALALVGNRACVAAFATFGAGLVLGFIFADSFIAAVALIPGGIAGGFLTGPIMSIPAGLSLVLPDRTRSWVLPAAAMIVGAMVAVAIRLFDPSVHDPWFPAAGIAFAFWILAAICLTVRSFRQRWFETAGRIFGSWLIAIGLLYGGASLIPPHRPAAAPRQLRSPAQRLDDDLRSLGPERPLPDLDRSKRQPLPGGFDPSQRP